MTDVPISWKITMTGAREAQSRLAALQNEFGRTEGLKRFNQEVKEASANTRAVGIAVSQANRNWKLQHQTLNEVSKAMNVFGRAMRAGMSIMNTLNLLTVAQSSALGGLTKDKANILADLEAIDLQLDDMRKKGASPLAIALKENEKTKLLNDLKAIEKQFEETAKNEAWTKWITAGFGISEGIQTALQILNNKKLMEGFTNLFNTITLQSGTSGSIAGATYGAGFLAGVAGVVTGVALGAILFPEIDKQLKEKSPEYKGYAEYRDTDLKKQLDDFFSFKWLSSMWSAPEAYGETSTAQPYIPQTQGPIFDTGVRPSLSGIASQSVGSISKVEIVNAQELAAVDYKGLVTFRDLTTLTEDNSEITTESNEIVKENTEIIKTEISAREQAKQREIELRNEVLANKLALIELTAAINKSMVEAAQVTGTATPTSGGGRGPYSSAPGFIGANGKTYSSASEAIRNNTQPIVNSARQIVGYKAANGFDGMVNSPTMFLAGEAGAEQVSITPARRSAGGGGAIIVNNYVSGSVISERELEKLTMESVKNTLKRAGF